MAVVMLGCGRDPADPAPIADPAHLFADLVLNYHAVTLALTPPYDTDRLVASPVNELGRTLSGIEPVHYTSSDTTAVTVDSDGVLQARAVALGVWVKASAYDSLLNVTHSDSVLVNVTPTATQVATFAVERPDAQSGTLHPFACGLYGGAGNFTLDLKFLDEHGNAIPDVAVDVRSSSRTVLDIIPVEWGFPPGTVTMSGKPGRAVVSVQARVYGTAFVDSLPLVVGFPMVSVVQTQQRLPIGGGAPVNVFDPRGSGVDTIQVGGVVGWMNLHAQPIDVVFDDEVGKAAAQPALHDTTMCPSWYEFPMGAGDIAPWSASTVDGMVDWVGSIQLRRFTRPGTYRYHSTLSSSRGRVVVVDQP